MEAHYYRPRPGSIFEELAFYMPVFGMGGAYHQASEAELKAAEEAEREKQKAQEHAQQEEAAQGGNSVLVKSYGRAKGLIKKTAR